jgi:hypothetical protein
VFGEDAASEGDRKKTLLVAAGSIAVTAALLALLFSLGSWAYQHRRWTLHERRLDKALQKRPRSDEIAQALLAEGGAREIAAPREGELAAFVARRSPPHVEQVLAKRRAAREMRVFALGGMVYFLFFDEEGRFSSYVLVAD